MAMAKRYCKFDKKGMGFQFDGCPSPDRLCFECASNIPEGEEVAPNYNPSCSVIVEKIEDAARDYVLSQREDMLHGNGVPTPEMREYLTFSYKEMKDAFLAGARWHAMTLQQDMFKNMNELNTVGFAEYLKRHEPSFIQDSNGDMMRKPLDDL